MPRISVFIASSVDNYIATQDDSLDWLDAASRPDEDYGYDTFIATVDAVALGRRTWDYISEIEPLPFGDRRVFVFTHRPPKPRAGVTFWERSPRAALEEWAAAGIGHVYLDGGELITSFLAEGLVDDLLLTRIPVLLGAGRPLVSHMTRHVTLTLVGMERFPSGIVNLRYARS